MASDILLCLIVVIWIRLVGVLCLGFYDSLRPRRNPSDEPGLYAPCDVTIVIPALNEETLLTDAVASVGEFLAQGGDLIIVDDGSSDTTSRVAQALIAGLGRGRLIRHTRNEGKAAALNAAIAAARTPCLITLDADTGLCPGAGIAALGALNAAVAQGRPVAAVAFDIGVAPGRVAFAELQGLEYDGALNFERRAQGVVNAISVCPGAASLWLIEDLRRIGGFRNVSATEDVDATLQLAALGRQVVHAPQARALTLVPQTLRQLLVQRQRWCLGHYQNMWLNRPRTGAPAAYTWLTYLNFSALSLFMPAMLLATLLVLAFEPHKVLAQSLWFTNVLWLASAYVQRAIALWSVGRRAQVHLFLIEPFTTMLLHLAAMASVARLGLGRLAGRKFDIWSQRAR